MLEAIRSELGPRFANEQQRAFFDSEAPELLYSGAFGAGKSRILCEKAYALAQRYPGVPIGIFRKVRASLAATTQITLFRDVIPAGVIVKRNVTDGWYELANGSRIWLLGLDVDPATGVPSKVGSLDLAFAFVDEAVELTEGDWTMLEGRLRWPGVPWTQLAGGTNPAQPDHWLIKRFTTEPGHGARHILRASTFDNRMLPQGYIDRMSGLTGIYRERYVLGSWVAVSGGMFDPAWVKRDQPPMHYQNGELVPALQSIVVAVDPAVTSKADSDETGIIVAGTVNGHAYILDDLSGRHSADHWPRIATEAFHHWKADRLVAEVNNGGDLVGLALKAADPNVPLRVVTATRGKEIRTGPVAQLYADGKVSHAGVFKALESQMIGYAGSRNDDRMDALVWALTDLMLGSAWGAGPASAIA